MVLYSGTDDSLAQPVEHMTFNHGVWSSILQWVTKQKSTLRCAFLFCIRSAKSRLALFIKKFLLSVVNPFLYVYLFTEKQNGIPRGRILQILITNRLKLSEHFPLYPTLGDIL